MGLQRPLLGVIVVLAALQATPVAAQNLAALERVPAWRAEKTLFDWRLSDVPPPEGPDRIVTDRPHFSEASSLVGLGVVQLETGLTYVHDAAAGTTTDTYSFGEPLLRWGIFADWFEFRLGYTYLVESTVAPPAPSTRLSGSDDLYIGSKLALTEQAGMCPEMAIFPQMRVPSGSNAFSSGEVLPGFNFAYSWVLNPIIEVECNTQLNRRKDDLSHSYTEFIQTANIEYELAEKLGAFTEWFCLVPNGALAAQTQHYFHAGVVYFVTPNIQLDAHSAVGLNAASANLAFTGVGLSIRLP